MSVMAGQETETRNCAGCQKSLPRSAFSASAWNHGSGGYCRDCRKEYQRDYMGAARHARREVEELRERVGSLEEIVASLVRRVA